MRVFSGERLKSIERALRRSSVNRKLLAAAGSLAILVPAAAGCGEQESGGDPAKPEGNVPGKQAGQSGPGESPAKPNPDRSDNGGDSGSDDFEIPETSGISVSSQSVEDINRDYYSTPGGFRDSVESMPVLGSDTDLEELEKNCQKVANEYFENGQKVEKGTATPEEESSSGITGAIEFINQKGYFSYYTCLSDDAQEMYGDIITQPYE